MIVKIYFDYQKFISIRLNSNYPILSQLSAYGELQDYNIFLYAGGRIKYKDKLSNLNIKEGDIIDAFKSIGNDSLKFKIPAILMN